MGKTHAPKSEAELSSVISSAFKSGRKLSITGGGTRPIGNLVDAEEALTTSGIKGITLYEPGALTIVAKSGTCLTDLNKVLEKENQHLPFEPGDYSGLFGTKGKSTIGGVVGAAVSGSRRIQVGGCRDSLIGVRFVDGQGTVIKNGGRVMKNVTGYDLVKLMAGSYGTLGVLSEVSFKVLPKPEMIGSVMLHGLEDQTATQVMAEAMSSPFDISAAAHMPNTRSGSSTTMIRVEGFTESIKYRTQQLKELLVPLLSKGAEIEIELDQVSNQKAWRAIQNVEPFHASSKDIWRLSVKPSDGWKIVEGLRATTEVEALYDWAGGLVWLAVSADEMSQAAFAQNLRSAVDKVGGHATLIKSNTPVSNVQAFHPEQKRITEISENLRRQFDPKGILNPGRMVSTRQIKTMVGA